MDFTMLQSMTAVTSLLQTALTTVSMSLTRMAQERQKSEAMGAVVVSSVHQRALLSVEM